MKYKVEWLYKIKGTEGVYFTSDWIDGRAVRSLYGEDIEKSNRTSELIFYDEMGQSWKLKELKKLNEEIEEDPHDVMIYFDGGYNRESLQSGLRSGRLLSSREKEISSESK